MTQSSEDGNWIWGPRGRGHPLIRVALFVVVTLIANLLHGLVVLGVLDRAEVSPRRPGPSAGHAFVEPLWPILIAALSFLPIALAIVYLFHVRLDRVSWSALWLPPGKRPLRAMLNGGLAGLILLATLALLLLVGGSVEAVHRGDLLDRDWAWVAVMVMVYVVGFGCQSGVEEIIFRGYLFRQLGRWRGGAAAIVGSAVLFSLAHWLNPAGGALALVNTFLIGLLLGLIRARHGLGSAIGVHAGWNLLMALSGMPLSGFPLPGLAAVELRDSAVWSGGAYGVEASVATAIVVALAIPVVQFGRGGRSLSHDWWWHPPKDTSGHPESPPASPGSDPGPGPTT